MCPRNSRVPGIREAEQNMPQDGVSLLVAFTAGVLSFLSPCVLPLVPSYISYVAGMSLSELKDAASHKEVRRLALIHSLLFILGFSIVFIILGASATFLGKTMMQHQRVITKIGGVIIVLFGLQMIGVFKFKFLQAEKRFHLKGKPAGYLGSVLIGMAFSFGWTPCVGPILATILLYASTTQNFPLGIALLVTYSLGLGVPMFISAYGINSFLIFFDKVKGLLRGIEIASGVFVITVGILIYTGYFTVLSGRLATLIPMVK